MSSAGTYQFYNDGTSKDWISIDVRISSNFNENLLQCLRHLVYISLSVSYCVCRCRWVIDKEIQVGNECLYIIYNIIVGLTLKYGKHFKLIYTHEGIVYYEVGT